MLTRRQILAAGGGMFAAYAVVGRADAGDATTLAAGLAESELIYLTPIRTDGKESSCRAEVWFVHYESDLYVVTDAGTWRAQAVARGLTGTRIWVGDVGVWSNSDGAYRELPRIEALASQIQDAATHDLVLDVMGGKYTREWSVWGPRFRNGLADGSRVMLRYVSQT